MNIQENWHEQDAFWKAVEPVVFSEQRHSDAPTEVENIVNNLGLTPPCKLLDLCCGTGRHTLGFARHGLEVTAVDRTKAYLETAEAEAKRGALDVEFVLEDMREFRRPETYDVVTNLLTSFGYFEDPEEDRLAARNMYDCLKPGGTLVMDMIGKEVIARTLLERDWKEEGRTLLLRDLKLSDNFSHVENRWIVINDEGRQELRFSQRLYSAVELSTLLKGIGFSEIEIFGNLAFEPYDCKATRLVVIARKK